MTEKNHRRGEVVLTDVVTEVWREYASHAWGKLAELKLVPEGVLPTFHCPPLRHDGSDAWYLFDYEHHGHRVLISFLQPHSVTTNHYHAEPIIEEYYPLAGEIYLNGELILPQGLVVPSGTVHQTSTRDTSALTLIVMKNAARIPQEMQHVPVH